MCNIYMYICPQKQKCPYLNNHNHNHNKIYPTKSTFFVYIPQLEFMERKHLLSSSSKCKIADSLWLSLGPAAENPPPRRYGCEIHLRLPRAQAMSSCRKQAVQTSATSPLCVTLSQLCRVEQDLMCLMAERIKCEV